MSSFFFGWAFHKCQVESHRTTDFGLVRLLGPSSNLAISTNISVFWNLWDALGPSSFTTQSSTPVFGRNFNLVLFLRLSSSTTCSAGRTWSDFSWIRLVESEHTSLAKISSYEISWTPWDIIESRLLCQPTLHDLDGSPCIIGLTKSWHVVCSFMSKKRWARWWDCK